MSAGRNMARVLITGCSSGIGRATAVELTTRGHEVVATARKPETLDDLDVTERLALDVTDDESVAAAVDAAGDIDVLVNNAGIGLRGPIETTPIEDVEALFATNVFGVIRMLQAVVPRMRERGSGVVVNVSSGAGRIGLPLSGYYSASKFSVEAISEVLHYETRRFGIRTVVVEPGYIATRFGDNSTWADMDGSPYLGLREQVEGADRNALAGEQRPGPEVVARVIADAIESDDTPLRMPAGVDAEMALNTRAQLDDAEFEKVMRETLKIDW